MSFKKEWGRWGLKEIKQKRRSLNRRRKNLNRRIRYQRRRGLKTPQLAEQRRNVAHKIEILQRLEEEKRGNVENLGDGWAIWVCPGSGRRIMVASWMVGLRDGPDGRKVNWLQKSVGEGWDGELSSGGRTPEYSERLCQNMCGAPSCPGRCAGRASNHAQNGPPNWGAVDVFPEYREFEEIQIEIGSPLKNRLDERDPVHFSWTGR